MLKLTNINYCGTVTEIRELFPLENSDNLLRVNLFGNSIIVGKDNPVGEIGVYFPPECQLSQEYLHKNNLYRNSILNADGTKKGYFEQNGRVRCVKLRGNNSEGIFMPLSSLGYTKGTFKVGDQFNEVNGFIICSKYMVQKTESKKPSQKDKRLCKWESRLIDNQFKFHYDTSHFGLSLFKLEPDDIIVITQKLHGSQFTVSKLLTKKNLSVGKRVLRVLAFKIDSTEYGYIWSSRRVLKAFETKLGFYKVDLWTEIKNKLAEFVEDGISLYGEAVGFLPNGASIQKGYDYGCDPKQYDLYIYRITYTSPDGRVIEFSWQQVKDYCAKYNLKHVPEHYYGKTYNFLPLDESKYNVDMWRQTFLSNLKSFADNMNDPLCINPVPYEGVCVRLEKDNYKAYKIKSFAFTKRETEQLDKGETNIEDEEVV